jgi:glycosyltransferase involved in cell wall biosynthesis
MTSGREKLSSNRKEVSRIMFVATTPFAVNSFLASHLEALSEHYEISLCVNTNLYALSSRVKDLVQVIDIGFERQMSPLKDLVSLISLISAVRRVRPAAIHSITPKAGLLAMLAGFLAGVPNRWHTFTGQVWATRRYFSRYLLKAADRLIVIFSTQVFADSASQCRFLRDEKLVPENGISVLGNGSIAGVDVEKFHPDETVRSELRNELGCLDDTCIFIFVGRLVRDKGVFDLVSSYCEVAARTRGVELWVVGPDEDGLLPELQSAGRTCGATIRWIGATKVPERYMKAADVLVLPSYREGFGLVIIEAGACSVPVVAYRIDGVIDAVIESRTGVLVDCGNIKNLSEALLALAENPCRRIELGRQSRERVAEHFRSDVVTAAWVEYYLKSVNDELTLDL